MQANEHSIANALVEFLIKGSGCCRITGNTEVSWSRRSLEAPKAMKLQEPSLPAARYCGVQLPNGEVSDQPQCETRWWDDQISGWGTRSDKADLIGW